MKYLLLAVPLLITVNTMASNKKCTPEFVTGVLKDGHKTDTTHFSSPQHYARPYGLEVSSDNALRFAQDPSITHAALQTFWVPAHKKSQESCLVLVPADKDSHTFHKIRLYPYAN